MNIWTVRLFLVMSMVIALRATPLHAADILQNGGFETGEFSPWTITGDPANTFVSFAFPHSGSYSALFGETDAPEFILQSLGTSPGQSYTLSFWMKNGDVGGSMPSEFIVKWGDITLLDQLDLAIPVWTNLQFTVTASSASTVLAFGGRNSQDYVYLDDVSVTVSSTDPPPRFLTLSNASGLLRFTWSASVGRAYQIQYRTSLTQDSWLNLGNSVTATNVTMAGSDQIGAELQRFYRVVLLP